MADRIRLYKFVTPPKEADGAQMTVGKKTFTTTGFVPTVKAINSLGATVNSIGLALKKNQEAQARIMEDQRRAAALQADRQREAAIEAEEASSDRQSETPLVLLWVLWITCGNSSRIC